MPEKTVNCGRCAHLWTRTGNGAGICACHARQELTGKIRQQVQLDATCEHAELSTKFDPTFMRRVREARQGYVPQPSILDQKPADPASTSNAEEHGKTYL